MIIPATLTPKLAVEPAIVITAAESNRSLRSRSGFPRVCPARHREDRGAKEALADGEEGGVGNGNGSGMEGVVAEPLRAGMQAPVAIYKFEPEYSEQARKARVQGTVVLEGVIDENGKDPRAKNRDSLGFGLDEQAIEAVKQWRFHPATRGGKPLAIIGMFYLTFRLL